MTLIVVFVLVLLVGFGFLFAWRTGLFKVRRLERTVRIGPLSRKYIVWLPLSKRKSVQMNGRLPVLLVFHGLLTMPEGMENQTALHMADAAGQFVIVYLEGYKRSWNAGDCCGPAMREGIDDRLFVRTVLDDLAKVALIDRRRVYATGFSAGARFCYYIAANMPDVVAAIAPVGGAVSLKLNPIRPVSIFHIHGLEDKWSPYQGGPSKSKSMPSRDPVEKGLEMWRKLARTTTESHETLFGGAGDCVTYSGGVDGTTIRLCRIAGLGHHWPGVRMNNDYKKFHGRYDLGPTGPKVDVRDAILKFLAGCSMPDSPATQPRVPEHLPETAD